MSYNSRGARLLQETLRRHGTGEPVVEMPGMRCRIYHSMERGHRFSPWTPEAPMKLVDDYRLPLPEGGLAKTAGVPSNVLELVYREQNAVDGSERNVRLGNRSLSVGDVVVLDERAFSVDPFGWSEIDLSLLNRALSSLELEALS